MTDEDINNEVRLIDDPVENIDESDELHNVFIKFFIYISHNFLM